MGCAVFADKPAAVNGKNNRQFLQTNIMHDLIVSSLQKSRINGNDGNQSFHRQTGGKSYRMLFRDTHIIKTFGKFLTELIQPCALAHCGGNSHNAGIGTRQFDHCLAEYFRIGWNVGW